MTEHNYSATIKWTGNSGKGTLNYTSYSRNHCILINDKAEILGSSDPAFRGDKTKHNPEELFIASISACHMLWYLHLCAVNHIVVMDYTDKVTGIMVENKDGSGYFKSVTLNPRV